MRFLKLLLIVTVSFAVPGAQSEELTLSSLSADADLIEQQSKLSCSGHSEDPNRVKLAESLMSTDGFAVRLLKRLNHESARATDQLNQADERLMTSIRNAKMESAKNELETAVKRLGKSRRGPNQEALREDVQRAYAKFQASRNLASLTESETATVRAYQEMWMNHLKTSLSLSDRISSAVARASDCHCKGTNLRCWSITELEEGTKRLKAAGEYKKAFDQLSTPSSVQAK